MTSMLNLQTDCASALILKQNLKQINDIKGNYVTTQTYL